MINDDILGLTKLKCKNKKIKQFSKKTCFICN